MENIITVFSILFNFSHLSWTINYNEIGESMILYEDDISVGVGSDNINEITDYWDQFMEIIGTPFRWNPSVFSKIQKVYAGIINRNYIQQPNPLLMPGLKIQINDNEKNEMLEAIGISMNRSSNLPHALTLVKNSRFFSTISKREGMKEKLSFFLPLVCYAANLYKIGRKNECRQIFIILAMTAYTSAVVESFYSIKTSGGGKLIHGTLINFDAMTTVMEYDINNKSDAKTKTIIEILQQKMDVSLNNYAEKNRYLVDFPLTDKKLNEIVTAGIISRIGAFVHELAEKYYKRLNDQKAGKSRISSYSAGSYSLKDENGETEVLSADYKSNSAIVEAIVNNALTDLTRPDPEIADKAVNINFGMLINNKDEMVQVKKQVRMTKEILGIISHIIDKYSTELPVLLRAILYAYLFDKKADGGSPGFKYGDLGFMYRVTKAFNNNRLDKNVNIIKRKMNLFLTGSETEDNTKEPDFVNGSAYYLTSGKSTRENIKKYTYTYFCLVLWYAFKNL